MAQLLISSLYPGDSADKGDCETAVGFCGEVTVVTEQGFSSGDGSAAEYVFGFQDWH
jgi:hypothetical protein